MSSARPVTAASGMPPAMAFAVVIRSGTTPSSSQANQSPVRQNPVWISSAMNDHAVGPAPAGEGRQEPGGGDDEAALALDRLDQHARRVVHADLALDLLDGACRRLLAGHALRVAVGVGHRHPVDLGCEGPKRLR